VPTPIKPPQVTIKLPTQQDKLALQVQALADEVLRSRLEEFKKAKVELDEAMTNRTASHPDVVRAQGRLNKAKDQLPPELLAELLAPPKPATPKPETPSELAIVTAPAVDPVVPDPPAVAYVELPIDMIPNPLYRTYAGQLQQLKTEEKISLGERDSIIKEMDILNKRVKETPGTEQRIAEVLRENFDLKKQYEDYSGKLTQTRLAESLAVKQKGTQFHVIDPANNPDSPEKPRKSMLAMWAAAVSLLFAIVLAIVVDVTRQRVWAASEVEALWDVPVLVDIPEIAMEADAGVARKKWRRQVTAVMAGAVVYGVCMYGISVNHSFILSQLDPLVQRIVYR
jgi:hypothetical protein